MQKVIETAFSDDENKVISNFAADLSKEITRPPVKSLVAEVGTKVIDYVCYSPMFLKSAFRISAYILAPPAVSPEHLNQCVSSSFIKSGIDILAKDGARILVVYDDPDYCRGFGFEGRIRRFFFHHIHCSILLVGQE